MTEQQKRELEIANRTPVTDEGLTAEGLDELYKVREILWEYSSVVRVALARAGRQESFNDMQSALTVLIDSPLRERARQ